MASAMVIDEMSMISPDEIKAMEGMATSAAQALLAARPMPAQSDGLAQRMAMRKNDEVKKTTKSLMKGKKLSNLEELRSRSDGKRGNQGKQGNAQHGDSGIAMPSEVEDEASCNAADGKKQAGQAERSNVPRAFARVTTLSSVLKTQAIRDTQASSRIASLRASRSSVVRWSSLGGCFQRGLLAARCGELQVRNQAR